MFLRMLRMRRRVSIGHVIRNFSLLDRKICPHLFIAVKGMFLRDTKQNYAKVLQIF